MATYPVVSRGIGRNPPSEIRIEKDYAIVTLTRGLEAIIDLSDLEAVAGYKWSALVNSQTGHAYAVRYERGKCILMHRQLMDAPKGVVVDHIDGDGLNNRRSNMRLATPSQNSANSVLNRRNKLGLKGVWEDRKRNSLSYRAGIEVNGKAISLGSYATPEEAAAAYKGAAKILFGEFYRAE